jgi:hypothetical protein
MKAFSLLLIFCAATFARFMHYEHNIAGENIEKSTPNAYTDRVAIDSLGDIRGVMGAPKNIIVCEHGDVIAVLYGAPSWDPANSMIPMVAYSLDTGATWTTYGPFGGACRRMYGAVTGPPNFCQIGGLVFIWQESTLGYNDGRIVVLIEENVPYAPSFSVPTILPNSEPPAMYPWNPDIAMAPDDPADLVATAWSYLAAGNQWAYCWISHDGGYTWTDTIPMGFIPTDGTPGILSRGTEGYVIYAYQAYYHYTPPDSIVYPYYMESTDGGYTWSPGQTVPGVPVNPGSQFWWHEFDCLVINNEPWLIYTDIGTPGGGPYVMHGTGSPGNWTWEIWNAGVLGTCSLTIADTTFYCYPHQYPSISYDAISNTILASYKTFFYKEFAGTIFCDGPHIGGIYTTDTGENWTISQPLSDANTSQIPWENWSATEVAHRMFCTGGNLWSYAIWVDGVALVLYFERGLVTSFLPLAVNENKEAKISHAQLRILPSIGTNRTTIYFDLLKPANVEINLYDASGRLTRNVIEAKLIAGHHNIDLCTHDLPRGVYFVSLESENTTLTKKIVLID